MITPDLLSYVRQQLAQGTNQDVMRQALIAQGWGFGDVEDVLRMASGVPTPPPPPAPPAAVAAMPAMSAPDGMFQQRYPLSSRKFLKKMIEKTGTFIVALIIIGMLAVTLAVVALPSSTDHASMISLGVGLGIVIWLVVIVLTAWYLKAYIRRYYYDANESIVTIKKGVFAPAEIHVQYSKIQDVYVDQDILDRIMGLYDVHLASATAASGIEAHIDGVDAAVAQGLKDFLLGKLHSGGAVPMNGGVPAAGAAAPSLTFSGDISSATYPIGGRWLAQQAVAWIFTSAIYSGFIVVYFAVKATTPISSGALTMAFIVLFVIIYIFHLIYNVLWRSAFSFAFLPDYIVTKSGIISKSETHLPYRSVQDVNVSQGIIERMFGLATVRIENAAQMVGPKGQRMSSAIRLPGQSLPKANEISDALRKVILTHSAAGTGL